VIIESGDVRNSTGSLLGDENTETDFLIFVFADIAVASI